MREELMESGVEVAAGVQQKAKGALGTYIVEHAFSPSAGERHTPPEAKFHSTLIIAWGTARDLGVWLYFIGVLVSLVHARDTRTSISPTLLCRRQRLRHRHIRHIRARAHFNSQRIVLRTFSVIV